MEINKAYQNLLNKMFMIENIGETIYRALISRAKDNNLRLVYERLALNERETAKCIAEEISTINNNHYIVINKTVLRLIKIICSMLTARQLAWILKSALKRRVYNKWYNRYNYINQDFWRLLLNHENLQHELLGSFWNS